MNVRVFTGSRDAAPSNKVLVKALKGADLVLVGCCPRGTDAAVLRLAREFQIDVHIFAAKWSTTSPSGKAGPDRNRRMAIVAAAMQGDDTSVRCFAFPKGESRGTRDCVRLLKKHGLRVVVTEL